MLDRLIHPALIRLTKLLLIGGLRSIASQVKKPSGLVLLAFILVMLSAMLGPTLLAASSSGDALKGQMRIVFDSMPLMLFAMLLFAITTEAAIAVIELRPAELQFVLAGPFTDCQILNYRLLSLLVGWVPMSLFFSVFMLPYVDSFLLSFCFMFLLGCFLGLIAIARTLATPRLPSWGKHAIQAISLLLFASLLFSGLSPFLTGRKPWAASELLVELNSSSVAQVLTVPMQPFVYLFGAPSLAAGLPWILVCGLLVVTSLLACHQINAGFSELAVDGIANRKQKIRQMQTGTFPQKNKRRSGHSSNRSFPMLKCGKGAGPLAWMQWTIIWRLQSAMMIFALSLSLIVTAVGLTLFTDWLQTFRAEKGEFAVPIAMGVSTYLAFLFSMVLPSGFCVPVRSLLPLKTLPHAPMRIAIGLLVGSLTMSWVFRVAFFVPGLVLSSAPLQQSFAILLFAAVADVAIVSGINFVGASTSLRIVPAGAPNVFQGAYALLFMLLCGLTLFPTALVAGTGAGLAAYFSRGSLTIVMIVAAMAAACCQPLVWWATGFAFDRREIT